MNSDYLREREGNLCSICITAAHNTVNRHNISAGRRSASHPPPLHRPLLADREWGRGVVLGLPEDQATPPPPGLAHSHPPTSQNFSEKTEMYQRGPNLEVDLRYTNLFSASTPPTHRTPPLSGGGGTSQTAAAQRLLDRPRRPFAEFTYNRKLCPPPPRVALRRVAVALRGPGQSPVLPFACCVGSLRSVGRCGRCSCWCRFRVRGAQSLVCRGCAGCGGMCRLHISGAQSLAYWGLCWLLRGLFDGFGFPPLHPAIREASLAGQELWPWGRPPPRRLRPMALLRGPDGPELAAVPARGRVLVGHRPQAARGPRHDGIGRVLQPVHVPVELGGVGDLPVLDLLQQPRQLGVVHERGLVRVELVHPLVMICLDL